MGVVAQLVGWVLIVIAAWLLWSPWALVAGGAVLLVAPEVVALMNAPIPPPDGLRRLPRTRSDR